MQLLCHMLNQILFLCQCKILRHIHIWYWLFQIILCNSEWWGVVSSTSRQLLLPLLVLVWVNCICYIYMFILSALTDSIQTEHWVRWVRGLYAAILLIRRFPLQCRAYTQALQPEKWISPLFPGPRAAGIANDWCISPCLSPLYHPCQIHETLAWIISALMRVV